MTQGKYKIAETSWWVEVQIGEARLRHPGLRQIGAGLLFEEACKGIGGAVRAVRMGQGDRLVSQQLASPPPSNEARAKRILDSCPPGPDGIRRLPPVGTKLSSSESPHRTGFRVLDTLEALGL
jgi:hypothetical protein